MPTRLIVVALGASTAFVSLLVWRGRKQARIAAEHAERMVADGPLIDHENEAVREALVQTAIHRAAKWMSYQITGANLMTGQVGGVAAHKRPLLTLEPDYVLKPLQVDHRGIREIACYEFIHSAAQKGGEQAYSALVASISRTKDHPLKIVDILAFSFGLWIRDPYVVNCERRIMNSWKRVRHEARLFHRLFNFVPMYFGVVSHETSIPKPKESLTGSLAPPAEDYGLSIESHLLLQDATINFRKPCVIDIKLGTQSYEPDAPSEKKRRETTKYKQQASFGFRIVGMRVYDPSSPKACGEGFVFYPKEYGRSLTSIEAINDALQVFFGAGTSSNHPDRLRCRSMAKILRKVKAIQHWFHENKMLAFYSSSLLIAYEGDIGSENVDMANVLMIDFGRVRRQAGGDDGYRHGLRTITNLLEDTLNEFKHCPQEL